MSKKARFRTVLVLIAGVGLFLSIAPFNEWITIAWLHHLPAILEKLGDALVLAPILALVIEIGAARELVENFVSKVSHHIVGHLLPVELREHILKYLTTDFVRSRWRIEYHIRELPDQPDLIELRRTMEYDLQNRSAGDREFDFRYELQKSWFPHVAEAEIKHASLQVASEIKFEFSDDSIKRKLTSRDGLMIFSEKVQIPRGNGTPPYTFTLESVEIFPAGYETALVAWLPSLGTTVRAQYHRERFNVTFRSSFGDAPPQKKNLDQGAQWNINEPVLAGQCLFLRWARLDGAQQPETANPGTDGEPLTTPTSV